MDEQSAIVKTTIEWDKKRITIEGPPEFVDAQTRFFAHAETKQLASTGEHTAAFPPNAAGFVAEKKPRGHHEMVAVLAFYLTEQNQPEFSEDEIKRTYIQARVRPPKVIGQALRDAKNKFDFLEPTKRRGYYKLSPHGDRTVRFDLPRATS